MTRNQSDLEHAESGRSLGARNIVLSLAGVLLALALLEFPALFKLVDYRESGWLSINQFDPELLFIHRRYATTNGAAKGGSIAAIYRIPASELSTYHWKVRYDRNGFRNATDLRSADIAVVGGSYVEGTTIDQTELMTSLLGARQNAVVANFGQNAYAPQQELIVLRRFALPLKPKTVLWNFADFNDIRQAPVFSRETHYASGLRAFIQSSFTANALKQLATVGYGTISSLNRILYPENPRPALNRSGILPNTRTGPVRMYFLHPSLPLEPEQIQALDDSIRIIGDANQLCAAQGARLVVVFIPDQFRVFHSFVQTPPGSELEHWTVNDTPARLEQGLREASPEIGFLDLTPVMVAAVKGGVVPYFTDDNHWNPDGQRLAAEAIDSYLTHSEQPRPPTR
jgi:hypothetical protein